MLISCSDDCVGSVLHAKSSEFSDFGTGAVLSRPNDSVSFMHECQRFGRGPGSGSGSAGLIVDGGKMSLNLTKCVIKRINTSYNVVQDMDGTLHLRDCEIAESSKGSGVVMWHTAKVNCKQCTIRDMFSYGVVCKQRSDAEAEAVHTMRSGTAGLLDDGRLKLKDCSSVKDAVGVEAARTREGEALLS